MLRDANQMRACLLPVLLLSACAARLGETVGDDASAYSAWPALACVGPTVRVLPFAVPSLDSCAAFCTSDPECYVFNYGDEDGSCALKEACTEFRNVAGSSVGVSLTSEWTSFRVDSPAG